MTGIVGGVLLLAVAAAALAIRYAPLPSHPWVFAAVAAPFALLGAPLALALLCWSRRWVLSALAAGLTIVAVAVQAPLYVAATTNGASVPVRVMTFNMLYGRADPEAIITHATDGADVLMFQELTPEALHRLQTAGIDRTFPHHLVEPRAKAAGSGVYSRYPMTACARISGLQMVMVSARLRIEGVTIDPTVASVHFESPWPHPIDGWHRDLDAFPDILAELSAKSEGGSILVGGDFNATVDMHPFRRLLTDGYRDASEQAGAGRQVTYRSNWRIPPFMGIDHVLTRDATAVSTETVTVPGSDHGALLATVLVPRQ